MKAKAFCSAEHLRLAKEMKNTQIATFTVIVAILIFAIYHTVHSNLKSESPERMLVQNQPEPAEHTRAIVIPEDDPFSESYHSVYEQSASSVEATPKQIATSGGSNSRMITWYFEGGSKREELDFDSDTLFESKPSTDK